MRLYGIGGETATTILAFILDYFQKNFLNRFLIIFSKNSKKKNLSARTRCSFCSNLVKNEFLWKKGFKYFNYLPSCQKSEKTNEPEKNASADGCTVRQTAVIL